MKRLMTPSNPLWLPTARNNSLSRNSTQERFCVLPTLLNIPLHHLLAYAQQQHDVNEIRTLKLSTLTGGYVAANVYRLDLEFSSAEDVTTVSFVQKHTYSYEVQVMKLLTEQLKNEAIPTLIDSY